LMIKKGRLRWLGHVEHRIDEVQSNIVLMLEVDRTRQRGCARKVSGPVARGAVYLWTVWQRSRRASA